MVREKKALTGDSVMEGVAGPDSVEVSEMQAEYARGLRALACMPVTVRTVVYRARVHGGWRRAACGTRACVLSRRRCLRVNAASGAQRVGPCEAVLGRLAAFPGQPPRK